MIGNDQPTKTKYKLNLGTWFKRIIAVAIGAVIATGVMQYLWLQSDYDKLIRDYAELKSDVQQELQIREIGAAGEELSKSGSVR